MARAIVFDFDGVIVRNSEHAKRDAWLTVLAEYGDEARDLLTEALQMYGAGSGGDRYDILRHIFTGLGKSHDVIPQLVDETADAYNTCVQRAVVGEGVHKEDLAALSALQTQYHLYVSSATPIEALQESVRALGINSYFHNIFGRPSAKSDHLKIIMRDEGCGPGDILFLGDSRTDAEAARSVGCTFIGIGSSNWPTDTSFLVLPSIAALPPALERASASIA